MAIFRSPAAAALAVIVALTPAAAKPVPPSVPNLPEGVEQTFPPSHIPPLAAIRCTRLATLSLPEGQITSATVVEATTGMAVYHPVPGVDLKNLPRFCRVRGTATPSDTSLINFEVWIPFDGSYRRRYLQVGNGGFSGIIVYDALAGGIRRGFATASTDDGNQNPTSAEFAEDPQRLIDYGHRALKQTTDKSKAIIASLTGAAPERSFFHGCSNGGREALIEAQRYGTDFDGILAGAPANYFTRQFASFAWNAQQIYPAPPEAEEPKLPASKLPALTGYILDNCAGRDGGHWSDRFLTNPRACRVPLEPLICPGRDNPSCLTAEQVRIAQRIYDGPITASRPGLQIFPGLERGSEAYGANWPFWITGVPKVPPPGTHPSLQLTFGKGFLTHFVDDVSSHDALTFPVASEFDNIDAEIGEHVNAIKPDLSVFHDRGGKLIVYHGFDDAAVAPQNSIDYWQSVNRTMRSVRPRTPVSDYYRLFMVPGFSHCAWGTGINVLFGDPVTGLGLDADHDFLVALERWVDEGIAPARLIGTHLDSNPFDRVAEELYQRPVCPYPQLPHYIGGLRGDPKALRNWRCEVPQLRKLVPDIRPKILPKRLPIPPRPPERLPWQQ